ncbi:MAG: hypothetical protein ACO2OY_00555 [Thermodesulfobacteriaceae bacterium]|jgi:hypothetical protein
MPLQLSAKSAPKLLQEFTDTYTLSEEGFAKILGEILHFSIEYFIENGIFSQERPDQSIINDLIERALRKYPDPLPNRSKIISEAQNLLNNFFKNREVVEGIRKLLLKAKNILIEPQAYFHEKQEVLRPDILVISLKEVILIEIKLRASDYSEEQVTEYVELLKNLFPNHPIRVYLLTIEPPALKEILREGKEEERYAEKLSHFTQLSLFG